MGLSQMGELNHPLLVALSSTCFIDSTQSKPVLKDGETSQLNTLPRILTFRPRNVHCAVRSAIGCRCGIAVIYLERNDLVWLLIMHVIPLMP